MSKLLREKLHPEFKKEYGSKSLTTPIKDSAQQVVKKAGLFITCLAICLLALGSSAKAQNGISVASMKKAATATEWQLYKQIDGVNIYYQFLDCGPVGNIFFKVKNTTNDERTISWKFQFFQDKQELETNPDDITINLNLKGMASIKGDCNNSGNKLMVFVREGNGPLQISEIDFSSLTVTKQN